jgi:hypothetical protein
MVNIQDALADKVPERYLVRTEERSYLLLAVENGKEERKFYPDVRVIEPKRSPKKRKKDQSVAATQVAVAVPSERQPMKLTAFVEEEVRETFIEIYATEPDHRLVTTIEVLSPTNKERGGHGWNLYLRKRQAALVCNVNLVEVDLLRGGTRMPMRDPWPDSPYTLLVARAGQKLACEVWPAYFQMPLPPLLIPLAVPDPDVTLELQPLVDAIYSRLRYGNTIDHKKPLVPPPSTAEKGWLKLVRKS